MMRMEHRQVQSQKQTQQLVLTQKMQQALHVLQLSGIELDQFIQQELETNPFLDQVRTKEEPEDGAKEVAEKDANQEFEENFDLDTFADKWDIKRREGQDLSYNADLHQRRRFYEDSITQEESLRAHLLTQMRMAARDEAQYAIGERIIGDIDEKGYFTGDCAGIAEELGVAVEEVDACLEVITRFEPTGVGARDMAECLLMQIEAEHPEEEELKILVRDHLDDLMRRQIPKIAKAMKVGFERVEALKGILSSLNPWPGHEYASSPTQYVTPDVIVEQVDDDFMVRLVSDIAPQLKVNDKFQKDVRKGNMNKEEKDYVRQKVESANWLKRNIAQRQQTILKVTQAIMNVQEAFLDKGVEHIKPLTLQDIADVVGVQESTVARTTRGKYVQTPQGLFELKYFFSPGLTSDNGGPQSSKSVQAFVKKIIREEDKQKPLSDQKIADMIKAEGITIARRTVTKYREAMGILKTSMRREY